MIKATHSRKYGRPFPFANSILVRFGCLKERDQRRGREKDGERILLSGVHTDPVSWNLRVSQKLQTTLFGHSECGDSLVPVVPPHVGPGHRLLQASPCAQSRARSLHARVTWRGAKGEHGQRALV